MPCDPTPFDRELCEKPCGQYHCRCFYLPRGCCYCGMVDNVYDSKDPSTIIKEMEEDVPRLVDEVSTKDMG